jgi:hypothetical protein
MFLVFTGYNCKLHYECVEVVLMYSFFFFFYTKFFSFQVLVFIVSYIMYVIILNQDKAVCKRQIKDLEKQLCCPFRSLFVEEVFVMCSHLSTYPIHLS